MRYLSILFLTLFFTFSLNTSANDINVETFKKFDKAPVEKKKYFFFNTLNNLIVKENINILKKREKLKKNRLSDEQRKALCQNLRVGSKKCMTNKGALELLKKLNIIPPSLAIAQAALESNWGTSRFAQKGNNLFGQWCFKKGCGIIPNRRAEGASHEVEKFSSLSKAVKEYARNLNSHPAYSHFRSLRNQNPTNGFKAAKGMKKYSSQGDVYVTKIKGVIKANDLQRFDKQFDF